MEVSAAAVAAPDPLQARAQALAQTWDGECLTTSTCALEDLAGLLPLVQRRPLVIPPGPPNPHYDLIVRLPDRAFVDEIPIGIVSKRYRLVQHRELLDSVIAGLTDAKLRWRSFRTDVRMTELGTRLHFTINLPDGYREPIGKDQLDLTIECLNSVDRSWALRVGMGWVRLVCGNGLFIGRLTASMRSPHVGALRVDRVPGLIASGFTAAKIDSGRWRARAETPVTVPALAAWTDGILTNKWGVMAAARAFHIARTGFDGRPVDSRERGPASQRRVVSTRPVPGSEPPNDNVFRVGQILAWLANAPSEWGARLEKRRQVPELLAPLVRHSSDGRVPEDSAGI